LNNDGDALILKNGSSVEKGMRWPGKAVRLPVFPVDGEAHQSPRPLPGKPSFAAVLLLTPIPIRIGVPLPAMEIPRPRDHDNDCSDDIKR